MATYKLIQDIEAEDHILGPLTLRQFIFGLIAAFLLYLCFISVAKHVTFLLVIWLPPALFCAFFALPIGGDQPTELWALAKLRFWFKPRKRIWSQSGVKELVTITVPKKVEHVYSDGLSQNEVKSRLQALANTIDSHGWAIKHIDAVGYLPQQANSDSSDRLIDITNAPQEVSNLEAADDMLDTDHNPIARQFETMIDKSNRDYRERLMNQMKSPLPQETAVEDSSPQWFMNHNPAPAAATSVSVPDQPQTAPVAATVAAAPDDAALDSQLKKQAVRPAVYGNLRTLQPLGTQTAAADPATPVQPSGGVPPDDASTAVTASGDPAILSLSNNNDLNVATIAREAQRAREDKSGTQGEVVISLH